LFQEKKTIREKSILPSRVHAGIAKTAQPSGLDGRGQDEYSIKTGSAGHSWAIRPRPPEAIEFGEVAAVLEVTRETATALRHSAASKYLQLAERFTRGLESVNSFDPRFQVNSFGLDAKLEF
jgi:hypothetical protein